MKKKEVRIILKLNMKLKEGISFYICYNIDKQIVIPTFSYNKI